MKRQAIVIGGLSCQTEYLLLDEAFDRYFFMRWSQRVTMLRIFLIMIKRKYISEKECLK